MTDIPRGTPDCECYEHPADLRYGGMHDPHAAVCRTCGWQGPMRSNRSESARDVGTHKHGPDWFDRVPSEFTPAEKVMAEAVLLIKGADGNVGAWTRMIGELLGDPLPSTDVPDTLTAFGDTLVELGAEDHVAMLMTGFIAGVLWGRDHAAVTPQPGDGGEAEPGGTVRG